VGLKPILRRVWSLPGQQLPIAPVEHRYDWFYVYGFVCPTTGRTFWLLMPGVSIVALSIALQHFMDFIDPLAQTAVCLLFDRAAYHTSAQVERPATLGLLFFPSHSPELQPAEHLWELVDQPLLNRHFIDLDALETTLTFTRTWYYSSFLSTRTLKNIITALKPC
jgi:hypothetical protein